MVEPTLTITVEGAEKEGGRVRVADLVKELELVTRAMRRVDIEVSGQASGTFHYRIISVSYASPLTLTLGAYSDKPDVDFRVAATDRFFDLVEGISRGEFPKRVNPSLLEDLKGMANRLGDTLVSTRLASNGREVEVSPALAEQVDRVMEPEEIWAGSLRGMLEYINIHEDKNVFRIYPEVGPPKINCGFPPELRDMAVSAVGRYVEVRGRFRQRAIADYPHEVDIQELEVLPNEDELPTLMDLRGIAPDATAGLSSEEFVNQLRDEWEAADILGR